MNQFHIHLRFRLRVYVHGDGVHVHVRVHVRDPHDRGREEHVRRDHRSLRAHVLSVLRVLQEP